MVSDVEEERTVEKMGPKPMNNSYKVESGIPIPPKNKARVGYPLLRMVNGESFAVPIRFAGDMDDVIHNIQSAMDYYKRTYRISTEIRADMAKMEVRVWRTS